MKKEYIVSIMVILVILLLVLTKLGIRNFGFIPKKEPKVISLEEIKDRLVNTKKIYVCKDWHSRFRKCGKDELEKIIDDQEVVNKVIDVITSAEELNGDTTLMGNKDIYSIYFLNAKDKVIVYSEMGFGYCIITKNKDYYLDRTVIHELGELMELEIPEVK